MMPARELMEYATVRDHFRTLRNYADFAQAYLDFARQGLQARIVCQNEPDCGTQRSRCASRSSQ